MALGEGNDLPWKDIKINEEPVTGREEKKPKGPGLGLPGKVPWLKVICAVVFVIVICLVAFVYARISTLRSELSGMQAKLTEMTSMNQQLKEDMGVLQRRVESMRNEREQEKAAAAAAAHKRAQQEEAKKTAQAAAAKKPAAGKPKTPKPPIKKER